MSLLRMEIEALIDAEVEDVNLRTDHITALQSAVDFVLPQVSRVFFGLKSNEALARCFIIIMRQLVEGMADETSPTRLS